MNRSALLVIVISVFWMAGSSFYYLQNIKGIKVSKKLNSAARISGSDQPQFSKGIWYSNDQIVYSDSFDYELSSLLERLGPHDTLHLIATYSDEGGDNINSSIDRARMIIDSISSKIDSDRLKVSSILDENGENGWNEAVHFNIINSVVPEDHRIIRFESGTVVKIIGEEQAELLHQLAIELIAEPNAKFDVIGHTSPIGDEEENYQMGRKRAWAVKKLFMDMGVEPNKLITESRGSLEPHEDPVFNDRVEISWKKY